MNKKIKKYYVNPDDSAVLAMSVVNEPAIESDFVYLSKQKVDKFVALESNEKHMIFGAALRPDFPIYRNDGVEEYYLEFSKEAVEKLSRNFLINGFQQNFTAAHKGEVEGITITESWIKTDMEKDKSLAVGLDADLPVGTWFIGAYCNNAEVWDKVKDGDFKGFSVEAIVDVNELQFEEQTPEAAPVVEEPAEPVVEVKQSILDKILNFITPPTEEEKPAEPVSEPSEPVKEPEVNNLPEPEQKPVTEPETKPEPQVEAQPNPLEEVVKNLKAEIEALKNNNSDLLEKIRELGTQPSAKPTNTNPTGNASGADAFKNWRAQMKEMIG